MPSLPYRSPGDVSDLGEFLLGKYLIRGGDQALVGMSPAILAKLLGILDKFVGLDDRRIVLVFIVAVGSGRA